MKKWNLKDLLIIGLLLGLLSFPFSAMLLLQPSANDSPEKVCETAIDALEVFHDMEIFTVLCSPFPENTNAYDSLIQKATSHMYSNNYTNSGMSYDYDLKSSNKDLFNEYKSMLEMNNVKKIRSIRVCVFNTNNHTQLKVYVAKIRSKWYVIDLVS